VHECLRSALKHPLFVPSSTLPDELTFLLSSWWLALSSEPVDLPVLLRRQLHYDQFTTSSFSTSSTSFYALEYLHAKATPNPVRWYFLFQERFSLQRCTGRSSADPQPAPAVRKNPGRLQTEASCLPHRT
jgi:hypothetical protein